MFVPLDADLFLRMDDEWSGMLTADEDDADAVTDEDAEDDDDVCDGGGFSDDADAS